ncbi:MAG: YHS domain-containing (seleno)protein [Luteibaculum sp.]
MRTLFSTLILGLFIVISAAAQDKMKYNTDNSNIMLEGYSPVSYLDLGLAQKGNKAYKSEYEKVVYYFTSAEQKSKFDANPQKYVPQFGGYCAFGVYAGAKFRPDPTKFLVSNGKYYLFLYNLELDAKELWQNEKDQSAVVEKANENWKKLQATYN